MPSLDDVSRKYRSLKFSNIADGLHDLLQKAEDNEVSYLELADMLAEEELLKRERKRVGANLKRSGFPSYKTLEEFDYRFQTTITKREVNSLLDFTFIDQRWNLIFIGAPGVGKTHLSIGIGEKAVQNGYKVLFKTAMELIELLELAELKGELKKRINFLSKFDLLIIDELGYLPLHKQGMFNLFQLINHFYEFRSIILTTNKDFTNWNEFFFDENVAVPIIDRLIHHSKIFMLGGESYRLKSKMAGK